MNEPYNSETVPDAFGELVQRVLMRMVRDIDNVDSWELALANMVMASSLDFEIEIRRFPNYVLERQAPNAPFSVVDMKREKHAFSLERYALGLEVDGELMGTPEGQTQFREHMETVIQATIRSFRVEVQAALIDAPRYWSQDFGVRRHRSLTSLREFTEQERAMFGAITHDPKGLYKMHALLGEWVQGQNGAPNFNFCVVPHKIALQHAWKHDYPTEAWRTGDAAAARNRTIGSGPMLLQTDLPMPVYISKPIHAKNLGDSMDLDMFERIATIGGFTVLEHSDKGPVDDVYGVPVPAIRTPTADMNGYSTYNMIDCINNCPRFGTDDEDGSIEKFTQEVIDGANDAMLQWDSGEFGYDDLDPFVTVHKIDGRPVMEVCKNFGEQHPKFRSMDFDLKQGKKFKNFLKMSDEEHLQLQLLLQAAQDLYEVPPNDAREIMEVIWAATANDLDEEWGAPKPIGAIGQKPYGYGTWNAVMSLLKNKDTNENWGGQWELGNKLSYPILRRLLYRIYRAAREVFPQVHREDDLPFYTRPTFDSTAAMVLLFRGWLERAKYPFWDVSNPGRGRKIEILKAGDLTDLENDILQTLVGSGAVNLAGEELYDFLTGDRSVFIADYNALRGRKQGETIYSPIKQLIAFFSNGNPDAQELNIRSIQLAFALAHLLKLLRETPVDQRSAQDINKEVLGLYRASRPFAMTRGLEMHATATEWRRDVGNQKRDYQTKGLCVWVNAFDVESDDILMKGRNPFGSIQFAPTNALIGDVPVGVRKIPSESSPYVYAQARFGAEHAGDVDHFGFDPRQFIVSQSVNTLGGPFVELLHVPIGMETHIRTGIRPHISERCDYVAQKLEDDPLARLGAFMFLFSKINRTSVLAMVEHGLCSPMNFILAWPFIRVRTMAMLFAEKGPDTCNLYFLLNDITAPVDGYHKMEYRHFSAYFGGNVNDPTKVMLIQDAALSGYESGLSSHFVHRDMRIEGMEFVPMDFNGAFAMDVPVNFTRDSVLRNDHNPIPITGFYDRNKYGGGNFANRQNIFSPDKPHFPTFSAYNAHYGFSNLNNGKEYTNKSYMDLKQSDYIPGEMYLKRTQVWNPNSDKGGTWTIKDGGFAGSGHIDKIDPDTEDFLAALSGTLTFVDKGGRG